MHGDTEVDCPSWIAFVERENAAAHYHETINVAAQEEDPESVLNHFRRMTRLRLAHPVLIYGDYELLLPNHEQIYAYRRNLAGEEVTVTLNFGAPNPGAEQPAGGRCSGATIRS
ncbi:hypothetical protein [Neolewinella sp.]|uniref:hypothetical protein n=1 Tax=Neolewinella sp. TaxID=2993543 RepID=UPI003B522038